MARASVNRSYAMLDPLDRHSKDSTLFHFTSKRLSALVDPSHLLIQEDEQFDVQKLVEPLEAYSESERTRCVTATPDAC